MGVVSLTLILMLIIGIIALFKKNISVTTKSELRNTKIRTFGIVTIAITLIAMLGGKLEESISLILFWLGIIIPTGAAIILKEPKITSKEN